MTYTQSIQTGIEKTYSLKKGESSKKVRKSISLIVSETEQELVILVVYTRVKNRVTLCRMLLLLELWKSLPRDKSFIKNFIPEFYTDPVSILIQDSILHEENLGRKVLKKRYKILQKLLPGEFLKKQEAVSGIAGLECEFRSRPTRGHNTRYGYTKHYKDKGNLPPEKPDYSNTPNEMNEIFLLLESEKEKWKKVRSFLLSPGKTNFLEIFF